MYNASEKWSVFYDLVAGKAKSLIDPATGLIDKKFTQQVNCPVCKSSSSAPYITKDGFTYVKCTGCSFIYSSPQLTSEAIEKAYNDIEIRSYFLNELLIPFVEQGQKKEFRERLERISALINSKTRRLLDVGCAAGNFLQIAGEMGYEAEGLELDDINVKYAKEKRNLNAHMITLEQMNYPEGSFDVVTLWDVLEHLSQPMQTLREISRVMRPGGILGLSTINHACLNQRLLRSDWRYWMPPDHICSFTPPILRKMLKDARLAVFSEKHTYMFEVLEEARLHFLLFSSDGNLFSSLSNKARKIVYVATAKLTQLIFGALKSGDIITIFARKME